MLVNIKPEYIVMVVFVLGFLLWCSVLESRINELEEELRNIKKCVARVDKIKFERYTLPPRFNRFQ